MDHLARIQKAIDHIEAHLHDDLTIEGIASVAGFSMWHFQRVFSAAVGSTVKDYVRSRRLTGARTTLATTDRRIIELALDCGFESQEAFGRAFKALFGCTPGEYRSRGVNQTAAKGAPRITLEYLNHLYGAITMEPRFEVHQPMRVVGVSAPFISIRSPERNNERIIPGLWQTYMQRRQEIVGREGGDVGVVSRKPISGETLHPDECVYLAGAIVSNQAPVPEGMIAMSVPAGEYAIFTHKGTIDRLEHTMNYIYGAWLPRSGRELRDAPDVEVYDQRFRMDSDDSEFDIWIPVK